MKLINLLFFTAFALLSCEKEEPKVDDCSLISQMQVVATEGENQNKEKAVSFTFSPNNAEFADLEYKWTINEDLIDDEKAPSSQLNMTFTENGIFEICMTPILNEGSNCSLEAICTTIEISSIINEKEDCEPIQLIESLISDFLDQKPTEIDNDFLNKLLLNVSDIEQVSLSLNESEITTEALKDIIATANNQNTAELLSIAKGERNELKAVINPDVCPNSDGFYVLVTIDPNFAVTLEIDFLSKSDDIDDNENDEEIIKEEVIVTNPDTSDNTDNNDNNEPETDEEITKDEVIVADPASNDTTKEEVFNNEPIKQLNCDDITIRGDVLQDDINGNIFNRGRAFFKVTKIDDANYTWTVNGQTLTAQERQDLTDGGVLFTGIDSGDFNSSNFRLGSGTHTIEVFVISPTVCPNGKTVTSTLSIPSVQ